MRRLWDWLAERPFRSSLIVMLLVAVPGYVRLGDTVDEAHEAADEAKSATVQLEAIVAAQERDRQERRAELCARDIDDRLNDRSMWEFVLIDLGAFDPTDPAVQEAITELDRRLPRLMCNTENVPVPAE